MMAISRIIPILLAAALAHAQNEPGTLPSDSASPALSPTTARILGNIPDGTPPPLSLPKPRLVIPQRDILQSTTHQQGGRSVTIRRIKPLPLPPLPTPLAESEPTTDSEFRSQMVESRAESHGTDLLFLGATVFRAKDAPPRTLVCWWPQDGGETITFWSSADFALIAGGINSFVDSAGETHFVSMSSGNVDIDRMADAPSESGPDSPAVPDFSAGNAEFQIVGVRPAADDLIAIQSLHDLYNQNLPELRTSYEGRERARAEREAYLKAHPSQPKNIILNYWRTEEPAAKEIVDE